MIVSMVAISGAEVFAFAMGFLSGIAACVSFGFWLARVMK